jgi:hypothetical protein
MNYEIYYGLIEEARLRPLCQQLQEVNRYPALRFIVFMEKVYCGDLTINNYTEEGEYNELAFSYDLNTNVFDEIRDSLRISPEKQTTFWEIVYKILFQQIIFIKNTKHFDPDQKNELLKFYRKGIKTRRLLDPSFLKNTDELISFIDESVIELEVPDNKLSIGNIDKKENINAILNPKLSKERKNYESFESLFFIKNHASNLIDYLIKQKIINKHGNWEGLTNKKTEFLALINVLKSPEFLIIRFSSYREVGRLFASQFNINISNRSLTLFTTTKKDVETTYKKLVSDFLLQKMN